VPEDALVFMVGLSDVIPLELSFAVVTVSFGTSSVASPASISWRRALAARSLLFAECAELLLLRSSDNLRCSVPISV
jgi:hypothetical protein